MLYPSSQDSGIIMEEGVVSLLEPEIVESYNKIVLSRTHLGTSCIYEHTAAVTAYIYLCMLKSEKISIVK